MELAWLHKHKDKLGLPQRPPSQVMKAIVLTWTSCRTSSIVLWTWTAGQWMRAVTSSWLLKVWRAVSPIDLGTIPLNALGRIIFLCFHLNLIANWQAMDLDRHLQGTPRRLLFWTPAAPPFHLHPLCLCVTCLWPHHDQLPQCFRRLAFLRCQHTIRLWLTAYGHRSNRLSTSRSLSRPPPHLPHCSPPLVH